MESFNGRFRDECLNEHWFTTLEYAKTVIEEWRYDYNHERPHGSLKKMTPNEFARAWGFSPPPEEGKETCKNKTAKPMLLKTNLKDV